MQTKYNPVEQEKEILKFWEKSKIYEKAKALNKGKKPFYFLDGPPYTSGSIHLGTAWNKPLKDVVQRYKRMKGFDVWDRAGYDMHGLPTELKVEAKLGLKHKDEIPEYGVDKFVKECRKFSLDNLKLMNKDFLRLGVWMDFENAYMSVKNSFIEGTWWLVKKAHENKRLYEGEKTMHWCADCGTALSKHELEYENVKDNSIFVKLPVKGKEKEFLIVWTTTPWTIPFNLAVMAGPEIGYLKVKVDDESWIVAKALANIFISSVAGKKFDILEEFKGEKLEGVKYTHPFAKYIPQLDKIGRESEKAFSVLMSSEYVDTSSGTGLVHCAPGCGPEDYEVGMANKIPPFNELDENGVFKQGMGKFTGLRAKKEDKKIIEALDEEGVLIATTEVEHEYPHCWRCKKGVIFRTTKQWFFKVEDLREKMRELNKKIVWVPDWAGSKQFDSWLDNLRDNGITRQRYWGSPVPIWKCDKCGEFDVIGSLSELKKKTDKVPADLHKPWIDSVKWNCSCGGERKRIPDILDVWIDAGTTSWNCLDYPAREDHFKRYFPPDFILEGKDQIRGWFNLLFVASMISMNKPSFKACYMHGFVNDALGRKMSKSLGNVISPYEVVDKNGADAFRYYTIGGANPGLDLNYNLEDVNIKQRHLNVLWNVHVFLLKYLKEVKYDPNCKLKLDTEEKYMLSKLHSTIKHVTKKLDSYVINEVPLDLEVLFLELSRNYLQLVREKSALGTEDEKKTVLRVVFETFFHCIKMFSIISPFICEMMYQNIKDAFKLKEESIHHFSWPEHDSKFVKPELEHDMNIARQAIQAVLSSREKAKQGVRWPLKEVVFVTTDEKNVKALEHMKQIICKQCNIKSVSIVKEYKNVKHKIKADFAKLGPDFGDKSPKIIARLVSESASSVLSHLKKEGKFVIKIDGTGYDIVQEHIIVEKELPAGIFDAEFRACEVFINTEMTPEIEAEGYSRELMRRVQAARKKAGLQKQDRINLVVKSDIVKMLAMHEVAIRDKVGAESVMLQDDAVKGKFEYSGKEKIKDNVIEFFFSKV